MLETLNDEQIELMNEVKNEFISLLNKKIDENEAIKGVKWLYKISDLKEPTVIIVDSPLDCQLTCNVIEKNHVENQVGNYVWSNVKNQILNPMLNQIRNQVRDQVWYQVRNWVNNQVGNLVGNHIKDQIMIQVRNQLRNQDIAYYTFSDDSLWSFEWVSFYSYFKKIGIVKNNDFDTYENYIKSGVFMSVYLDGLAVLCKNPLYILRDEDGRMHNTDGYAIEWDDGYGQNYIHGAPTP